MRHPACDAPAGTPNAHRACHRPSRTWAISDGDGDIPGVWCRWVIAKVASIWALVACMMGRNGGQRGSDVPGVHGMESAR